MKKKKKSLLDDLDDLEKLMDTESIVEILVGRRRRKVVSVRKRRRDQ